MVGLSSFESQCQKKHIISNPLLDNLSHISSYTYSLVENAKVTAGGTSFDHSIHEGAEGVGV